MPTHAFSLSRTHALYLTRPLSLVFLSLSFSLHSIFVIKQYGGMEGLASIAKAYLGEGSGVGAAEAARLTAATDYAGKKQTADDAKVRRGGKGAGAADMDREPGGS